MDKKAKIWLIVLSVALPLVALLGVLLPISEGVPVFGFQAAGQPFQAPAFKVPDGGWVGRTATDDYVQFDGTTDVITAVATNYIYACNQAACTSGARNTDGGDWQLLRDDDWIGRSGTTSSIAFDASGSEITQTVTGGGCRIVGDSSSPSIVCGNADNAASSFGSVIAGGGYSGANANETADRMTVIGGGYNNYIGVRNSTIGGGINNYIDGTYDPGGSGIINAFGVIGGGNNNEIREAEFSAIPGGQNNTISGTSSLALNGFILGSDNTIHADANPPNFYGASYNPKYSVILGAGHIISNSAQASVLGGHDFHIYDSYIVSVLGGSDYYINNSLNSIVYGNGCEGGTSIHKTIETISGTVMMANGTNISYTYHTSVLGGSYHNVGTGTINDFLNYATIVGGRSNAVTGDYALAAGRRAKANHDGALVWADSTNADFASSTADQFNVRAVGGSVQAAGWFAAANDAQAMEFVARRQVAHTDTTSYTLFLDGSSDLMVIPSNGLWNAEVQVVGLTSGAPQRFVYNIDCSIVNDGGTTTLLSSSTTTLSESDAFYEAFCEADDANDALLVRVGYAAGGANYTIRWVASVHIAQVIY